VRFVVGVRECEGWVFVGECSDKCAIGTYSKEEGTAFSLCCAGTFYDKEGKRVAHSMPKRETDKNQRECFLLRFR
jgi:hypothetical protein